jgi:predicted RNA-binding Zn ribbon-like protein
MQSVLEMPFVGGGIALDLVNTAEERGHPAAGDALVNPADLLLWGQRYGLLANSVKLTSAAEEELGRTRHARDLLYDIFFARIHGGTVSRAQLNELAELARTAYLAGSLQREGDGSFRWVWSRADLATVRHVAVTNAVELLSIEPTARLKQCPGDHCGWMFLDTTKRGNRRWCVMSECGQDAKDERRRAARSR